MKIIHTSDWHLGLDLANYDRHLEQENFLNWLANYCLNEKVNALLVSGDIYDVANPSVQSQNLFAKFLVNLYLKIPSIEVVITGGNHDSAQRLEIPRPFGQVLGNIHIVGNLKESDSDLFQKSIIPLKNEKGEIKSYVIAVPFMKVQDLDCKLQDGETINSAYDRSLVRFYQKLITQAKSNSSGEPLIGMGHFTMMGGSLAGSEQPFIGGIDSVGPDELVKGLSYMAMGHIHRAQKIKGEYVRYSGSPISISFDERHYKHQILQLTFEDYNLDDDLKVESIEVPQWVEFIKVPEIAGSFEDLENAFAELDFEKFQNLDNALRPFIQLQVKYSPDLIDLRDRTKKLIEGKPIRVIGSTKVEKNISSKSIDHSTDDKNIEHLDLSHKDSPKKLLELTWQKHFDNDVPKEVMSCFDEILAEVLTKGDL